MALVLTALITAALVLLLILSPLAKGLVLDHPNSRSLHRSPIPRTGGIAVVSALSVCIPWLADLRLIQLCALVLATLSLLDDWRGLPQWLRLSAHLLSAAGVALAYAPGMEVLNLVLAILAIAWMTNLYNFMDGSDGLAGGMAVIGFSVYGIAAYWSGPGALATFCFCIVAASIPFLVANTSPARIFLGDVGSIPLGFLAGCLGFVGWVQGHWSVLFPLLVFSPFIVDASVTLCRRLLRGEKIWQAHRSHYYQRLVQMGWSHRKTALMEYLLMIGVGALALLTLHLDLQYRIWALGFACLLFGVLAASVDVAWNRHRLQNGFQ